MVAVKECLKFELMQIPVIVSKFKNRFAQWATALGPAVSAYQIEDVHIGEVAESFRKGWRLNEMFAGCEWIGTGRALRQMRMASDQSNQWLLVA